MANRRIGGGMGGFQRGNRPFSQSQPFQGGVSPWQGNAGSSNQGILSQITTNPQQLALALSSLLQPQQNNPPSLLSLNTSPAFSNQDSVSRFGGRNRDFRRHEPYNKNRSSGWRSDKGNRGKPKDKKDDKKEEKKTPKKDDKVETVDLSVDEEGSENKKRDWKDEKNADHDKKDDEKNEDVDKYYTGVPKGLLCCFVCNKNMWDGLSFHKHVNGRAHKQMLQSLDESFHITVNILRESMRLAEEKKLIEFNRMERLSKKHRRREPESTCNMCDLKFLGKIVVHRKTEGHQRLKRFLHPNCDVCNKEFSSRMDWVEHRLTEDHLKALGEHLQKKKDPEDGNEIVEEQDNEFDLEPLLEETMQCEDDNPILELTDDLKDLQNRIPAYRKNRAVGTQSLTPFAGFVCEICRKSFVDEDVAQSHLKSQKHYHAFIDEVKNAYQKQLQEAAAAAAKNKEKEEKEGDEEKAEENGGEEACNEEEEAMETEEGGSKKEEVAAEADDGEAEVKPKEEDVSMDDGETEVKAKEEDVSMTEEETPKQPTPTRATRKAAPPAASSTPTAKAGTTAGAAAGPKSKRGRK